MTDFPRVFPIMNIAETKGCLARTTEGKIIGRVQDIIYSPEKFKLSYPENYLKLSAWILKYKGVPLDEMKTEFPLVFIKDECSYTQYIPKSLMENFVFVRDPRPALEILRELILAEDFKKYRYMTHTTPKWKECLKEGVEPRTYNRFLELTTKTGYSMWVGNEQTAFDTLSHVDTGDSSGIIITQRTSGHLSLLQYLLENDMLSARLLYIFDELTNWFISFDVIEPEDFIMIYSMTGERLWVR